MTKIYRMSYEKNSLHGGEAIAVMPHYRVMGVAFPTLFSYTAVEIDTTTKQNAQQNLADCIARVQRDAGAAAAENAPASDEEKTKHFRKNSSLRSDTRALFVKAAFYGDFFYNAEAMARLEKDQAAAQRNGRAAPELDTDLACRIGDAISLAEKILPQQEKEKLAAGLREMTEAAQKSSTPAPAKAKDMSLQS